MESEGWDKLPAFILYKVVHVCSKYGIINSKELVSMMNVKRTYRKDSSVHAQQSAGVTLCGRRIDPESWGMTPSEVNCGQCLASIAAAERMDRTCTVCGDTKDIDDFYYNSALDTTFAHCKDCQSKLNALRKKLRKEGKKISVKEFRDKKLYKRMMPTQERIGKRTYTVYKILEEVAQ
jgi:hypothetical protein